MALAACSGPESTPTPPPSLTPTATPAEITATATAKPSPTIERPAPTAIASPAATATPEPIDSGAAVEAPAPDGLVRGGILRFAAPGPPPHLDVHQTHVPLLTTWGAGLAYSRLFRFATGSGAPSPNTIVECDLCRSWRLLGPTTLEVTLRSNVRWHSLPPVDGRYLVAGDVAFSYERQKTAGWPNAALLVNVSGVEALDDRTLLVTYLQPEAEFMQGLADGHSKIVAREAVEEHGDLLRGPTVGTGPWVVVRTGSEGAAYEANADYFEDGVPYLDGLDVQVVSGDDVSSAALRNGLFDLARVAYQEVADAKQAFPGIESSVHLDPGAGVEFVMNTSWKPFESTDVRRGALLALNPWTMSKRFVDGQSAPTLGLRLPSPDWLLPRDDYGGAFAKPSEARTLLAAAADSPVIITAGQFNEPMLAQARFIVQSLSDAGMDVRLREVSTREYGDRVWVEGDFQAAIGALPPVESLTGGLLAVHHSRGGLNTTLHHVEELDELIEMQAREFDPARRKEHALAIQRLILSHAYRVNLSAYAENWMWWDYVEDFAPNIARGENHFFATTWLSSRPEEK